MSTVNPLTALSNLGQASAAKSTITNNFDTFLTLLTTQLQNQNPLEPLDTNQFTQQLVQFSEVEQAIQSNANLESLLQLQAATAVTNSVAYIGKTVELNGTSQPLKSGQASWPIEAQGTANAATFTIKDSAGNVVFSETKPLSSGKTTYSWNGQTNDGGSAPEGDYHLSVEASNSEGEAVKVNIASSGVVTGVDMSGNSLLLLVGDQKVKLEDVTTILQ